MKIPDFDAFFNSGNRSDSTDANHHRKPNQPIFPTVGFKLLCPFTRRRQVESGLGRKPTRPDPWTTLVMIALKIVRKEKNYYWGSFFFFFFFFEKKLSAAYY